MAAMRRGVQASTTVWLLLVVAAWLCVAPAVASIRGNTSTPHLHPPPQCGSKQVQCPFDSKVCDQVPEATCEALCDVASSSNFSFLLMSAFMVFFMKAGFIMLEYGASRVPGEDNRIRNNLILYKTTETFMTMVSYFLLGYSIYTTGSMFGGSSRFGTFLADSFFGTGHEPDYGMSDFLFHLFFASNCATIMTGAVIGRVSFLGYLIPAFFVATFIHPFVARWAWSLCGGPVTGSSCPSILLNEMNIATDCVSGRIGNGFVDLAGGMVVHGVGGMAALVLAMFTPPSARQASELLSPDTYLTTLGVFILWFAWHGFNAGSALGMTNGRWRAVGRVTVVMTLSAATAGLCEVLISLRRRAQHHKLHKLEAVPADVPGPSIKERKETFEGVLGKLTDKKNALWSMRATDTWNHYCDYDGYMRTYNKLLDHAQWYCEKNIPVSNGREINTFFRELVGWNRDDPFQHGNFARLPNMPELPAHPEGHVGAGAGGAGSTTTRSHADDTLFSGSTPGVAFASDHSVVVDGIATGPPQLEQIIPPPGDNWKAWRITEHTLRRVFGFVRPALTTTLASHNARTWAMQQWEQIYFLDPDETQVQLKMDVLRAMGFSGIGDLGASIRITDVLNCAMSGLVAATACGHIVPAWWGLCVGAMACAFYHLGTTITRRIGIKDTLDVFSVHYMGGTCGALNVIAGALGPFRNARWRNFYNHEYQGGFGELVALQVGGWLAISLFTFCTTWVVIWAVWVSGMLHPDDAKAGNAADERLYTWHKEKCCCFFRNCRLKSCRKAVVQWRRPKDASFVASPGQPRHTGGGHGLASRRSRVGAGVEERKATPAASEGATPRTHLLASAASAVGDRGRHAVRAASRSPGGRGGDDHGDSGRVELRRTDSDVGLMPGPRETGRTSGYAYGDRLHARRTDDSARTDMSLASDPWGYDIAGETYGATTDRYA